MLLVGSDALFHLLLLLLCRRHLANNQRSLLFSVWAPSVAALTKHSIIADKLCDTLLGHGMIPMTALKRCEAYELFNFKQ